MRSKILVATVLGMIWCAAATAATAQTPHTGEKGAVSSAAPALPPSALLSDETKAVLAKEDEERIARAKQPSCGDIIKATVDQAAAISQCEIRKFLSSPEYARLNGSFPVSISDERLGGVPVEVFTPKAGIRRGNLNRVLINLHGGGFLIGSRIASKTESMPIAATGGFKVISIDYRQAPANTFPAASDDVEAVYKALLEQYRPQQIGIYGCSSGGLLTAESVARFQADHLPLPGAVGMLCDAAAYHLGDSSVPYQGRPLWSIRDTPYFFGVKETDALAFPWRSSAILAKFPPSLLISATRDFDLSSVVYTHSRLVALGVDAELHVWEGLGHGFFYDPRLPEAREAYNVIVKFFDTHLAR